MRRNIRYFAIPPQPLNEVIGIYCQKTRESGIYSKKKIHKRW